MEEHPLQVPAINLTTTDPAIPGWHRETTFLRDYPHEAGAAIFVIGAYNGTIADLLIQQEPDARFYLFEPQDWAAAQLRERFGHLANVRVCEFGLGDRSGMFRMARYGTYFCSFVRGDDPLTPGAEGYFEARMEEFGAFMEGEGLDKVYYASLNIEGYEFALLPYLHRRGWLQKIQTIGISWHAGGGYTWLDERTACYDDVQLVLAERHDLVLSIDNWQSWALRELLPFEPEPEPPPPKAKRVKRRRRTTK